MMAELGPWPGEIETPPKDAKDAGPGDAGYDPATGEQLATLDAGIPFWLDEPALWDTVVLGGTAFQGLVVPTGRLARKLDKKNAKGSDKATITDDGADAGEFELVLRMWTRDHWVAYQSIVVRINPNTVKGKLAPLDVAHPVFDLHGISSVYVEELTLPEPVEPRGVYQVRMRVAEWRPPPKKKPKASKTTTPEASKDHEDGHMYGLDEEYADTDTNSGTQKSGQKKAVNVGKKKIGVESDP